MEKIVVIGSSGAGKSMFASKLSAILNINVSHLDRLFWQSGWEEKTGFARKEILQDLLFKEQRWIIDGNYLRFAELHVNAADTIIFLEMPPLLCFWRLILRHFKDRRRSRDDIPEGCTDRLTLPHLFKVLIFRFEGKRTIEQTLLNYPSKRIIRLQSVQEVTDFFAEQRQNVEPERMVAASVSAV
jgi:adenylate kinase family enzyme